MNLELVKRAPVGTADEQIGKLSDKLNLHPLLTRMLFLREIDSEEAIKKFLYPDKKNLYDPFLLKGMREAVERITLAIENNERIVVYGDYDADGICAAAILSLYLSESGLDVYTHIPSRTGEGYGLSIESLERIIEQALPDLIITCDCGISGKKEVDFAQSLGVDVIVTDHHEVSLVVPDCIVINPKLEGCGYPIDYLCGAGVALKVVHALGGLDKAMQFLDLAALATIADLVPLKDENRLIVQLGLSDVKKMNKGLKALLLNQQIDKNVLSSDIAYKIAPRVNAAGRMGDAYRAFELFTTNDISKIETIISEINDDNARRKASCDEMYIEAINLIKQENLVDEYAVILSHPSWEKGITGILAARIASEYKRPSFILVNSGDSYKGTSRSIQGINIYDLLSGMSDILVEFGGHSQAAGFSILKEHIPVFKERVNKYLSAFDKKLFTPVCEYDCEIEISQISLDLAKELDKMEPIGNSNPRPVFKVKAGKLDVAPCKSNFAHTSITAGNGLQILAFNFYNENQFLMGDFEKELALEIQLNSFNNRESVKTVLKSVKPSRLYINEQVSLANCIKCLQLSSDIEPVYEKYDFDKIEEIVPDSIFGTLVIAYKEKTYEKLLEKIGKNVVVNEFMYNTSKNNYSKIMVSPIFDENMMLSNYTKIIFADPPVKKSFISYLNSKTKAKIFVPEKYDENEYFAGIDMSRDAFSRYFDAIRKNTDLSASNIFSYFKALNFRVPDLNLNQFIVCFLVFSELQFIFTPQNVFSLKVNANVKNELTNSSVYKFIRERI